MARIFCNAGKVFLWLGEERRGDKEGWEYLSTVREAILPTLSSGDAVLQQRSTLQSWGLPSRSDKTWQITKDLLQRRWFPRPWILQEFVLAKELEIRCDSFKLDFGVVFDMMEIASRHVDLRWALMRCGALDTHNYACIYYLLLMRDECRCRRQWDLQILLHITCLFRCSDPRDRLFGLARLTNQCAQFIDYSEDWNRVRIEMADGSGLRWASPRGAPTGAVLQHLERWYLAQGVILRVFAYRLGEINHAG